MKQANFLAISAHDFKIEAAIVNKGVYLEVRINKVYSLDGYEETILTFDKRFSTEAEAGKFTGSKLFLSVLKAVTKYQK